MIWPSNYIPRFVSKRSEIHVQTKTYMQVFMVSLITIAKTWNNSNVQQQVKGKSSVIYPYNGMPLNAIKDVMSQKQADEAGKKRHIPPSSGFLFWLRLEQIRCCPTTLWRMICLLNLWFQCLSHLDTPSWTHAEITFNHLAGQPLIQSNWHLKLTITVPKKKFWSPDVCRGLWQGQLVPIQCCHHLSHWIT